MVFSDFMTNINTEAFIIFIRKKYLIAQFKAVSYAKECICHTVCLS